jgi:hypothetical protein
MKKSIIQVDSTHIKITVTLPQVLLNEPVGPVCRLARAQGTLGVAPF